MKRWMHWALKAFVNDCSIGFTLIVIGFMAGICYNILWNFFLSLWQRF
jgi:hypothetical protein